MADIGLNQNLTIGSRQFHIQTATYVDEGIIKSEVFEKGRLLYTEHYRYERRDFRGDHEADQRLRRQVDQFHHSIIEVLDSLFDISEKLQDEGKAASHEKLGLIFLYMHIFDKAEQHLMQAIDKDPARYSSYVYLARCFYFQKRYNQAYDVLSSLTRDNVPYPDLHNLMGLIMLEKKNLTTAFNHFKEAIKLNPAYIESYWNLSDAILQRVAFFKVDQNEAEIKRNLSFLKAILKKIESMGGVDDRKMVSQLIQALSKFGPKRALSILQDFREKFYIRRVPPEVVGYEFYLRLCYSDEEMSSEMLQNYQERISNAIEHNPTFPDLWNYIALVHLMQCRFYFLQGLDNFREATRINPQFDKARKNLRLVENDGREFLSLIKAIV